MVEQNLLHDNFNINDDSLIYPNKHNDNLAVDLTNFINSHINI